MSQSSDKGSNAVGQWLYFINFIKNTDPRSFLLIDFSGQNLISNYSQIPTSTLSKFIVYAINAVTQSLFDDSIIDELDKCWEAVCEQQFCDSLIKISKINSDRLHQNAKAIVASTQLASLAMVGNKDRALDSAKELIGLLTKLPTNINIFACSNIDQVKEDELWINAIASKGGSPSDSERVNIVTTAKAQASLRIKGVFKQLSKEGYSTIAAHYWTDYFLQQHSKHEVRYRQAYPLGYKTSGARAEPFLAEFGCYLLKNKESVIIEHPETCLLPLGEGLISGINRAWGSVKLVSGAVVWKLLTLPILQDGDSLSAVVATTIYSLCRDTYYNNQLAITGVIGKVIDRDEPTFVDKATETSLSNFKIIPVEYEAQKLEGAIKRGFSQAVLAKLPENVSQPEHRSIENLNKLKEQGLKGTEYVSNIRELIELTQLKCPKLIDVSYFPGLPKYFQKRTLQVKGLIEKLLSPKKKAILLTGALQVGLQGMGGIGKTSLALTLCDSDSDLLGLDHNTKLSLWRAFPDGIIWIQLKVEDKEANLVDLQNILIKMLELHTTTATQTSNVVNSNKTILKEYFASKRCLLILDNLWKSEQLDAFNVLGANGRMLVTSRNIELLGDMAEVYELPYLSDDEGLQLLADWAKEPLKALPLVAKEIAHKWCKNLPLGITLCGALIRDGKETSFGWTELLEALKTAEGEVLKHSQKQLNINSVVDVSLKRLSKEVSKEIVENYRDLAVFPTGIKIPFTTIATFWKYSEPRLGNAAIKSRLTKLHNRALLKVYSDKASSTTLYVELHDLLSAHLKGYKPKDKDKELQLSYQQRQNNFLNAYCQEPNKAWYTTKDDGYIYQNLAYHFHQANRVSELRDLLVNYNWLEKKLAVSDVDGLISDYSFLDKDDDVRIVARGLGIARHILIKDKKQLPSQLLARVQSNSSVVQELLSQTSNVNHFPWIKPLSNTFLSTESPLIATLEGHTNQVNVVEVYEEGRKRHAISGSNDKTLKIWDLEKKTVVTTLYGHTFNVNGVKVYEERQKKYAISASSDKTIKIWDLEKGEELFTLYHNSGVEAVEVYEDKGKKCAIAALNDETLKIWDLEEKTEIAVLVGHTSAVDVIEIYDEGGKKYLISGSWDKTLKIWDLEAYTLIATLTGHTSAVDLVKVYEEEGKRYAISASWKALKLWNLEKRIETSLLEGHINYVYAIEIYKKERKKYVISAPFDNTLKVWDLEKKIELVTLEGHSDTVKGVKIYEEGGKKYAISASVDKTLRVWDLEAKKELVMLFQHAAAVYKVEVYEKEGKKYVVSISFDKTLKIWNLETHILIATLYGHTGPVRAVEIYEEEGKKYAISASDDNTLKIWDLDIYVLVATLYGHAGSVGGVKIYKEGEKKYAISLSEDKTLRIWDLEKKAEIFTLERRSQPVYEVFEEKEKKYVISVSQDNTLKIWNLEKNILVTTLYGHTSLVSAIEVYKEGGKKYAISASMDKTLKIWDLEKASLVATLEGHMDWVKGVKIYEEGEKKYAISVSMDKTLKIWSLENSKKVSQVMLDYRLMSITVTQEGVVVVGDSSGRVHFFQIQGL